MIKKDKQVWSRKFLESQYLQSYDGLLDIFRLNFDEEKSAFLWRKEIHHEQKKWRKSTTTFSLSFTLKVPTGSSAFTKRIIQKRPLDMYTYFGCCFKKCKSQELIINIERENKENSTATPQLWTHQWSYQSAHHENVKKISQDVMNPDHPITSFIIP